MQDVLERFLFENAPVRGELVQLDATMAEVLARHPYPAPLAQLIGELMAAAALLTATVKLQGSLVMQLHGTGAVKLIVVECLSDNPNRTASAVRVLFRKGQLGSLGSVSWDFDHLGMIEAEPADANADAELAAIEAGAQDFEPSDEGNTLFVTDLTDLDAVCKALPEQGFTVNSAKIGYMPKNPVSNLTPEQLEEVEAFLEALDNHDDVQNVYVGLSG